jgi:hypothetical protein
MASEQNLNRVVAGVNTARHKAYSIMLRNGYKTSSYGVIMQRPNAGGYNKPGTFVIDD